MKYLLNQFITKMLSPDFGASLWKILIRVLNCRTRGSDSHQIDFIDNVELGKIFKNDFLSRDLLSFCDYEKLAQRMMELTGPS